MSETLGQWLAERRNALGFSLRDVERVTEAKVSNALLSQIETGHIQRPSAYTLSILAAVYSLDEGEMLRRAGDPNAPPVPILCPTCGRALP